MNFSRSRPLPFSGKMQNQLTTQQLRHLELQPFYQQHLELLKQMDLMPFSWHKEQYEKIQLQEASIIITRLKRERAIKNVINYDSDGEFVDQKKTRKEQWMFSMSGYADFAPKTVIHRIRDPSIQDNSSFILPYFQLT